MIFVDTNVFTYAVGRPHPLRDPAREFFAACVRERAQLCTSAEVLQELIHAYLPAGRIQALDAALALVSHTNVEVWPLEKTDVALARQLHDQHPSLQARDLCHLASCRRRDVQEIKTFDKSLANVSSSSSEL